MSEIFVSGLINLETSLNIDHFPLEYSPVHYPFYGIESAVSGVGYNVARALVMLENRVRFASYAGNDHTGRLVLERVKEFAGSSEGILPSLQTTPQSVILYDKHGKRQIHVDLKDIQEQSYPLEKAEKLMRGAKLAVLCNVNFSRPLLNLARKLDIPVATDVHALSSTEDEYNRDFMEAADILFLSDENIPLPAEKWIRVLSRKFSSIIIVIGMGEQGALIYDRKTEMVHHIPAVKNLSVVNTIGAGDALFSSFVHFYLKGESPVLSLQKACFFAACKIGAKNASLGFITEKEVNDRVKNEYPCL